MARKKVLATDNTKAVDAVMSEEFLTMKDSEALNVGLALQEILRGQHAMLANQDRYEKELHELRAKMAKYDEASAKFEENKDKYINEVFDKAQKLKETGSKKDKLVAKGSLQFQAAVQEARAVNASDKLRFEEELRKMPKVKYTSPGVWVSGMSGGQPVTQLQPEEVRIKHLRWVLQPGVEAEIPKVVADNLNARRRSDAETAERQALLQQHLENDKLTERMSQINQKYHTNSVLPFQSE